MTAAIRIIPLKFASHHDSFFLQTYDLKPPLRQAEFCKFFVRREAASYGMPEPRL